MSLRFPQLLACCAVALVIGNGGSVALGPPDRPDHNSRDITDHGGRDHEVRDLQRDQRDRPPSIDRQQRDTQLGGGKEAGRGAGGSGGSSGDVQTASIGSLTNNSDKSGTGSSSGSSEGGSISAVSLSEPGGGSGGDGSGASGSNGSSGSDSSGSSGGSGSSVSSGDSGSGSSGSNSGGSGSGDSGSGDSGSGSNSGSGNSGSGDGGSGKGAQSKPVLLGADDAGRSMRDRELVVVADDLKLADRAQALGFVILERSPLSLAGVELLRLQAPQGVRSADALALLRRSEPGAASGYNHVYFSSGPDGAASVRAAKPSAAYDISAPVAVIDGFATPSVNGVMVQQFAPSLPMTAHGEDVTWLLSDSLTVMHRRPDRLLLANIVESYANGASGASLAAIIRGLDWASSSGAKVINLSFAGPENPALQRSIERLQSAGVLIVAAVGNVGPASPPAYPASYSGVMGVTAVDKNGRIFALAGRGSQVSFAAAGVDVKTSSDQPPVSGTSYAAPVVAAIASTLRTDMNVTDVWTTMIGKAMDLGPRGKDKTFGYGLLEPAQFGAQVASAPPATHRVSSP